MSKEMEGDAVQRRRKASQARAEGVPVVGFRRGCLPELLDHRRTGL